MAGNHMPGSNLMLNINYRSTWFRVLAAMAAIVVFVTTYMLILPAITLEQEPICGTAAHEHTEECYSTTQVLTCSQGEYEGHTHSEACYDEEGNNICGMEEYEGHTHSEACYSEENQLICSVSEHQHTDSCYPEEPVQKEEVSSSSENQTTEQPAAEDTPNPADDSQTTALTETQTESQTDPTIGTICGDPNADLEDEAIWKATFQNVELTGNWSEDILAIAKTQLGYHESTSNYYKESATQNKGITRYGQWYGDRYGDWCAMFVSFCIYYAEVKDYPLSENCADWIRKLSEINLYHPATETVYLTEEDAETYEGTAYVVKPGDLIFFHNGIKPEVASDHVGIVKTVTPYEIVTIEGNASDSVKENTYSTSSTVIVGYGEMTENPNPPVDEEIAVLSEEGTEVLIAEEIETEAVEEIPAETKVMPSVKRTARAAANSGISLMSDGDANGAAHDFTNDINDIYVSVNGNYITPTGGVYQISQYDTVTFDVEYTLPGHTLDNTNTITYHVPTNGLQAQSGDVMGTVNGVAKTAGTYTVTSDGTVTIVFNDEFVAQNQAGNPIDGTIALHENANAIAGNDSNQGNIKFRDDKDYTFQITDRVVTNYDLSLTKTQSSVVDGKVTYIIEVSSSKGTDNQQVSLTDTLNRMQINGNVTIQDKNGSTIATLSDKNGQGSFNYNLPAMNAGDKYTITYQAEAAASEIGDMVYGSNTAKAEFTDHDGIKYEPTQTIYTNFDRSVISKDGYQNGNEIVWTITVNNSHQNIAGWELTDEMMQGVDINVSGGSASDYTYDKTNGKLTFNDNGTNTNTYTITFSTPVTESQYGTGVTNTATLKDKNQNPHTADKQVWVNRPAEVQPVYKTGTKQSDGSILWTITVVGAADVDLANKVLTDDAFKDPTFQLVSVTRNYWNGNYDVTQDYVLDTSAGTLTFNPINGGANTNRYEIKYTVMPTYQLGQNTFTNVGQLSGYSPVTSTVDGGNIQPGSKTGNGTTVVNDTVIANWHATVGGDFELQGPWTFQDWLDEDSGYYTMEQLKEIEASIRNMGITNFTMTAFTSSTQYNPADGVTVNSSASGDGQYKKYVITFQDTLAKGTVLSWDYHSTGAGKDQTKTYTNHAKLNDTYQYDASVTYESVPLLKKINLYGDTLYFTENNPNMNYVNWLLEINIPAGTTDTEWTITEHVPEGLNPVYIDAVLNQNGYPNDENFSITYSKDGSGDYLIKFNPSLYAGQTKYIKVAGLVRESEIPMNSDKSKAEKIYSNSASITDSDGNTYEVPPVDKKVEREYVDNTLAKGATFDQATGIITYHIDIDPSKVVDDEDKSYSVVDEITYNHGYCKLDIVPGSIIVRETLTGRALTAAECLIIEGEPVDQGTGDYKQKIYFTIVSDQPICIEYQYQYNNVTGQLWGHGVKNKVTLENGRGWKSETENQTNNDYKESDATAVVNSYPVYKVDAADHTTFLPGATFTIYKWDNNSRSYVQDATAITEADGSLRNPNGFTRNVAYKIVETAAPTGYQVNTTPVEFYTKDKNTVKYPMSVPEDFSGTVLQSNGIIYFEDTRVEGDRDTQISVVKNWEDYLGNDISSSVNTDIQFTLHRIEKRYNGSGEASGSDAIPGVVVKFRYSDGYFTTMYLENASVGDSITAKLTSSWMIYDENGNLNESYLVPSVNGVQCSASSGYNSSDRYAFYAPITVNARVITIDIPYDKNNGNNAIALDCYVNSSLGGGVTGSSLIGTYDTVVGTYSVTKSGDYTWNSQTLPAYRVNGDGTTSTYTYYIEEIGVQGYLTSYSRNDSTNGVSAGTITITNTQPNENEDTQIEVQKVWRYSDNTLMIDEDKPADAVIEVWQVANGDKANAVQLTDKTVTLDASNNWKETLTNLPKVRKSGNDVASYTYYFVEQTQAGYEVTYSNGDIALSQGTVIITNKQTDNPEDTDTSVTASKVWKDASGSILETPTDQNIILDLYQIIDDGEPTRLEDKSITLPDNGSWSKTIENLPLTRIDEENSAVEHQYKYYFVEREVPTGYEVSYTNTAAKPMTGGTETITNTKTTGITVVKQWKDANGNDITGSMGDASVQIQLIQVAGGSTAGRAAVRARAAARSGGGYTVNYGFGHYGASGLVSGTETCDSGTVMTITITSVNTPTVRTWSDGYSYDWNSTTISPTGDPVDAGNGFQAYTYQITITDNLNIGGITADNDGTVTVSFSGDSSGGESGGGESGGGESGGGESGGGESGGGESGGGDSGGGEVQPTESVYATDTLSAANNWTASFANLPVTGTNASGQNVSYTYYVREISVPNYETSYSNNSGITDGIITVINTGTKRPEYTEVIIEKKWIGSDDKELSPAALVGKSARFKLMTYSGSNKDDATQYGETFTLPDENGNWTKTFTNLPKITYDTSGNAVHWKYYFEEVAAEETTEINYQKESIFSFLPWVNGSEEAADEAIDGGTVTVKNKILPETTTVSVAKEWRDSAGNLLDASQIPADTVITVNLYKITDNEGEPEKVNKEPIELSAENTNNTWRYEQTDLVKKEYVDGEEHTYTYFFSETKMDGYNTEYQSGTSEPVKDETTIPIAEGTFWVINKQVPTTSVTVSKQWFRNTISPETDITDEKSGYIEFYLYRVATPNSTTHEHTWDEGVVTTEPGEYTEGVRTYTCTGCGETRNEPIGARGHTHNWTSSVTTAATCSSTGVRTYTCSGCGDSYQEAIDENPNNHSGGTYIDGAYDATDTTDGYSGDTKCSGCGATLETGNTIPATGGGEVDPPVTDTYTITIWSSQWNSPSRIDTINVQAGQSVVISFKCTSNQPNTGWYLGDDPNSGGKLNCEVIGTEQYYPDPNNQYWTATRYIYQITYTPSETSSMYLNGDNTDSEVSINVTGGSAQTQSASARMAAPRLMSAPARSAASQTPSIPDGAEIMNGGNTCRVYSNKGWTDTWIFEAEEGYTYTYYVVEVGNENFTTTYEGQGGGNITINNTITETTYSLPHTGGMGTKPITMLGMLLMAAATSLMISKKHRKEENW